MQRAALPSHRQEVEGSFAIRAEEQAIKASTLAVYGLQCKVAWAGDEPLDLPDEVEELLVDDELKDSRPGVRLLWATLLDIYPTEQARTVAYDTYYGYTCCGQRHLLWLAALNLTACTLTMPTLPIRRSSTCGGCCAYTYCGRTS